jgi:hypothetical protein
VCEYRSADDWTPRVVAVCDYAQAARFAVEVGDRLALRLVLARLIAACSDWEMALDAERLRAEERGE